MNIRRQAVLPAIGIVTLAMLAAPPAAQAFRGRGAAFAVGAAAGSSSASNTVVYATPPPPPAAPAAAPAPAPAAPAPAAAAGEPLPIGVVVAALPSGCTATPVGNVNYYYCGGNFYQAVYEGSTLKYITAKPQ